jgi:hypothetical protein
MPVGPLKVARADRSRVRTLTDGVSSDGTSSRAAWSPDGKWVVFERTPASTTGHRLFVIRADGTHLRRLVVGRYPAWSPNGKLIAFERTLGKGVWVIPAAGGKARRISSSGSCPTWSPGGRWIALLATVYRARPSPQPPETSHPLAHQTRRSSREGAWRGDSVRVRELVPVPSKLVSSRVGDLFFEVASRLPSKLLSSH